MSSPRDIIFFFFKKRRKHCFDLKLDKCPLDEPTMGLIKNRDHWGLGRALASGAGTHQARWPLLLGQFPLSPGWEGVV